MASLTENSKQGTYSGQPVLSFTKAKRGSHLSGKKPTIVQSSCLKMSLSFLNKGTQ